MNPSRPIRASFDGAALLHNYQTVRQSAPHSRIWAVVKANAYGHGLWRAVDTLAGVADGFAILEPETGAALREAGIRQPILLLEGIFHTRDARLVLEHDLTSVVHCFEQLEVMIEAARFSPTLALYIKLNTGMNRLGFSAGEMDDLRRRLRELPLAQLTWMTHFANADDERGVEWQVRRFRAMTGPLDAPVSLGNSAAILRHAEGHGDWVRPGIMLYGASPFAGLTAAGLGLKPVMALESRLIAVQHVAAGERVGYGGTYVAEHPMRVGVVACGYADGYPRHAPTGTPIAVCGRRTQTLGRVSMDMLACDVTHVPQATIGAPVTLWGEGEGGSVPADEVAAAAGTIAYELFCALAARVPVHVKPT